MRLLNQSPEEVNSSKPYLEHSANTANGGFSQTQKVVCNLQIDEDSDGRRLSVHTEYTFSLANMQL